jgi:hypothetical protein
MFCRAVIAPSPNWLTSSQGLPQVPGITSRSVNPEIWPGNGKGDQVAGWLDKMHALGQNWLRPPIALGLSRFSSDLLDELSYCCQMAANPCLRLAALADEILIERIRELPEPELNPKIHALLPYEASPWGWGPSGPWP